MKSDEGNRDGAVVRALASHQCGPGSIPKLGVICRLSLLLVLVPAPRGFHQVIHFSPLHIKQHFQNFNSIWKVSPYCKTHFDHLVMDIYALYTNLTFYNMTFIQMLVEGMEEIRMTSIW